MLCFSWSPTILFRQILTDDLQGVIVAKRQATDVRKWAILGAEQRLQQITEEARAIYRAFPELRRAGRGRLPAAPVARAASAAAAGDVSSDAGTGKAGGRRRRRRNLSPEARKRISDAQKARWAKHRATAAASDGARKKR
jgi:hypothetical protein